jgi:hypothetical protein
MGASVKLSCCQAVTSASLSFCIVSRADPLITTLLCCPITSSALVRSLAIITSLCTLLRAHVNLTSTPRPRSFAMLAISVMMTSVDVAIRSIISALLEPPRSVYVRFQGGRLTCACSLAAACQSRQGLHLALLSSARTSSEGPMLTVTLLPMSPCGSRPIRPARLKDPLDILYQDYMNLRLESEHKKIVVSRLLWFRCGPMGI